MSQLYDGRNFPEYCYEDCIMEVEMSSRYASADSPATYLYLPITQIQQARSIARAGGNFYEDMCLRFLESEQGQFNDRGYVSYHGTLSLDELMQGNSAQNMGPQLKME